MRKIISSQSQPGTPASAAIHWLDLEQVASVEISSEDPHHPFENALPGGQGGGWKAAAPGPQTIRLSFDGPQPIRKIRLEFWERERERSQEFVLLATSASGKNEIVRQQWTFSPSGSVSEVEEYNLDLPDVLSIELKIDPGRHDLQAIATLESIEIA